MKKIIKSYNSPSSNKVLKILFNNKKEILKIVKVWYYLIKLINKCLSKKK